MFVEYAKATSEDIAIRITAWNRGPEPARLHILPTLWFRNRWAWGENYDPPQVYRMDGPAGNALMEMNEYHYGKRWLLMEGTPELLFTDNETNMERLFQREKPHALRERRVPSLRDWRRARGGESGDEGDESRRALRRGNRRRQGKDHSRFA